MEEAALILLGCMCVQSESELVDPASGDVLYRFDSAAFGVPGRGGLAPFRESGVSRSRPPVPTPERPPVRQLYDSTVAGVCTCPTV
jgi:hypothetical protein